MDLSSPFPEPAHVASARRKRPSDPRRRWTTASRFTSSTKTVTWQSPSARTRESVGGDLMVNEKEDMTGVDSVGRGHGGGGHRGGHRGGGRRGRGGFAVGPGYGVYDYGPVYTEIVDDDDDD